MLFTKLNYQLKLVILLLIGSCLVCVASAMMVQSLPISYKMTTTQDPIWLSEAKTSKQQAIGLMNQSTIPANCGMVFTFPKAGRLSFWMKQTLIPLDMIFLNHHKIVDIVAKAPPCGSAHFCPSYGPDIPADQVIELTAGRARQLGLATGQSIILSPVTSSMSEQSPTPIPKCWA